MLVRVPTLGGLVKYDIEGDWTILHTCNFRCSYCWIPTKLLGQKIQQYATPQQWGQAFDRTGLTWYLHLTGGEPLAYPKFIDLCEILTVKHVIALNTNLSLPAAETFAKAIDPNRVTYVMASLHTAQRQRRTGSMDVFFRRCRVLQDHGFLVLPETVATSEVLADWEHIRSAGRAFGVHMIPKIRRGEGYPLAYTPEEQRILREAWAETEEVYASRFVDERPVNDLTADAKFLTGLTNYKGRRCGAGQTFVGINPPGEVTRCAGGSDKLGNILRGTFRRGGMTTCKWSFCPYFCERHSVEPAPTALTVNGQ